LCESALVVHDTGGGYRVFLGADHKVLWRWPLYVVIEG